MKQDLQLLLHKVFHSINVSCSILNTSFDALLFKYQDPSFGCMSSFARVLHMVRIGLYKIGMPRKHF